jgi:penicillin-binding protein 2
MANLAASLANRGHYITPHVVRSSQGVERRESGIDPEKFESVIRAMSTVITAADGTGRRAATPDINVCGKTGTVQNPRGNHSVFIAFAPKDDPQIALSVYVENAGAGGDWAAPIASLMIEHYLNGHIEQTAKQSRILAATYPFPEAP